MNSVLQPPHIIFGSTKNAKKFEKEEWHPTVVRREEYYRKVLDPKFQLPVHSLAAGTGLEWHFEVPGFTHPLCYLSAGAMVFPYQSPPWCLGTSGALKQLTEEVVVNYSMELLVNKEHCVCCGLHSADNVATREDAAKALPADQFEGIFNTEVPGPNRNTDDKFLQGGGAKWGTTYGQS